jgi:hypothetical protein
MLLLKINIGFFLKFGRDHKGRAFRYNLLFFKEKNKRISTAIPHAKSNTDNLRVDPNKINYVRTTYTVVPNKIKK